MIRDYYQLTKPRMVYGNLIVMLGGFFLASHGTVTDWPLFAATLGGLGLIIASACVFNNCIDRDIDARMERTRDRALVTGRIPLRHALILGSTLGTMGVVVLALWSGTTPLLVAVFGLFAYVVLYSLWGKRSSIYGTHIGALAGATPPVVGYTAVTGQLDAIAFTLFIILALWQIPHFFAVAIRRLDDYRAAGIPVMPVRRGIRATVIQMIFYIALFAIATMTLRIMGVVGMVYLGVMGALDAAWLALALVGLRTKDKDAAAWARGVFVFSLIVLMTFSIMIAVHY